MGISVVPDSYTRREHRIGLMQIQSRARDRSSIKLRCYLLLFLKHLFRIYAWRWRPDSNYKSLSRCVSVCSVIVTHTQKGQLASQNLKGKDPRSRERMGSGDGRRVNDSSGWVSLTGIYLEATVRQHGTNLYTPSPPKTAFLIFPVSPIGVTLHLALQGHCCSGRCSQGLSRLHSPTSQSLPRVPASRAQPHLWFPHPHLPTPHPGTHGFSSLLPSAILTCGPLCRLPRHSRYLALSGLLVAPLVC